MDLMEEMWISRPQRRMTKLSDLSDGGQNWTTSTLGAYTLTDLIYVDSNWYAIGSNGTKRLLLQNTASTFDQSNKILDLPDYSRQVIKINT